MAIGGYVAAGVVYYGSLKLFGNMNFAGGRLSHVGAADFVGPLIGKGDFLFLAATLAGGLFAALAAGWWACRAFGFAATISRS